MSSEDTLRGLQAEAHQMKSSIKKHDNLVEKYKKKVWKVFSSRKTFTSQYQILSTRLC